MKTKTSLRRKFASIKHSRWAAYATAGAAITLAGASSAEADIIYSGPINRSFHLPAQGEEDIEHLALTGGVFLDFHLLNPVHSGVAHYRLGPESAGGSIVPGPGTQFVGFHGSRSSYNYASRLASRKNISNQQFATFPFLADRGLFAFATLAAFGGYPNSQWVGAGLTGFLGFQFNAGNGTQYGWARVHMDSGPTDNNFTLVDFAFGDPGQHIKTGQKTVPESAAHLVCLRSAARVCSPGVCGVPRRLRVRRRGSGERTRPGVLFATPSSRILHSS